MVMKQGACCGHPACQFLYRLPHMVERTSRSVPCFTPFRNIDWDFNHRYWAIWPVGINCRDAQLRVRWIHQLMPASHGPADSSIGRERVKACLQYLQHSVDCLALFVRDWRIGREDDSYIASDGRAGITDDQVHNASLLHVRLDVNPYIRLQSLSRQVALELGLLPGCRYLLTLDLSLVMGGFRLPSGRTCCPDRER